MKRLLALLMIFCAALFSCKKDEINPLKASLIGSTWTVSYIEILNLDNTVLRTVEPAAGSSCTRQISFRNDQHMLLLNSCGGSGCGEWSLDNNAFRYVISVGPLVPNLCVQSNFQYIYVGNDKIGMENEMLMIEGLTGAFDHLSSVSDWFTIREQAIDGQIKLKTYYNKADHDTTRPLFCCGQFSWI